LHAVTKEEWVPIQKNSLNLSDCTVNRNKANWVVHVYVDRKDAADCKKKIYHLYNQMPNYLDRPVCYECDFIASPGYNFSGNSAPEAVKDTGTVDSALALHIRGARNLIILTSNSVHNLDQVVSVAEPPGMLYAPYLYNFEKGWKKLAAAKIS
jgi:hypothetical protein